jgi:hypothetical protein
MLVMKDTYRGYTLQLNDLYDSQADVMQQEERLRYLKHAFDAKERSSSQSMRAFVNRPAENRNP